MCGTRLYCPGSAGYAAPALLARLFSVKEERGSLLSTRFRLCVAMVALVLMMARAMGETSAAVRNARGILQARGVEFNSIREVEGKGIFLDIGETQMSDLSTLSDLPISHLSLKNCSNVTHLTPLAGLDLVWLVLEKTNVRDLSPLEGKKLELLNANQTIVDSIEVLHGMPLSVLWLQDVKIGDIGALEGMPLRDLDISGTSVTNISVLNNMDSLRSLFMANTRVRDLSPLAGLPLNHLLINHTDVTTIHALEGMPLMSLYMNNTSVTNIDALAGMNHLRVLHFRDTLVKNISALRGMPIESLHVPDDCVSAGQDILKTLMKLKSLNYSAPYHVEFQPLE